MNSKHHILCLIDLTPEPFLPFPHHLALRQVHTCLSPTGSPLWSQDSTVSRGYLHSSVKFLFVYAWIDGRPRKASTLQPGWKRSSPFILGLCLRLYTPLNRLS
jgi:hypothetical protein